ncbi:MAG: hypothetical protein J0L64_03935 [Acidobacteria bacterium]|nr:hypothetical protein [Acidobacteriota bacterium]
MRAGALFAALTLSTLLLRADAPSPRVLLREAERHSDAAIAEAAAAAPDEAVVLLRSGSRPIAQAISSAPPAVRVLLRFAEARCVPESACPAAAVFYRQIADKSLSFDQALALAARREAYFHQLVTLRLQGPDALFDRVLHQEAETIRSAWMEGGESRAASGVARMPARDLYALLAYGQREESEISFARFFDHELAPRLAGGRLLAAMQESRFLRARHFLVEAIRADRQSALATLAGAGNARLLALAAEGIASSPDPVTEGALAAEILEAYAALAPHRALEAALRKVAAANEPIAGLLAAWLERLRPGALEPATRALAAPYRAHLPAADTLDAAQACPQRRCTQRMMFFDDDDGVASFAAFEALYKKDPRWQWDERAAADGRASYIRVSRTGASGVTVEVFANRPRPANGAISMAWEGAEREANDTLATLLTQRGAATLFVQRGHAYHVPKAIAAVAPEARFVFLGGCRGTEHFLPLVERAPAAHVIATRSTGTLTINDPLLKAINDELADRGVIDWPAFWSAQSARFGRSALFGRYIPPHRNGAVLFLQGWQRFIAPQQASR